jgi:sulfur carrier protein
MQVFINKTAHEMAAAATLADAVALLQARPPFAAAVNMEFVPNTQYAKRQLAQNDRIDIILPVTGG